MEGLHYIPVITTLYAFMTVDLVPNSSPRFKAREREREM